MNPQAGILGPVPAAGRHLTFDLRPGAQPRAALANLAKSAPPSCVIGLGLSLVQAAGGKIEGLRVFPGLAGPGVQTPSTQRALWVFLRGETVSECFDDAQSVRKALGPDFTTIDEVSTFVYRGGRDLSGYEDGTENPKDAAAEAAAIVADGPLKGSSFVAVQTWRHDLPALHTLPTADQDNLIGRHISDNQEFEAPATAHVKRAAQESYDPPAFMLRRSMPWSERGEHGLVFVAFGESLDRYERVLRRMIGLEDGLVDGLFSFTRPLTGGYYWCPPQEGGHIVLSAIGL